jgi:hypothetical protein
LVAVDGKSFGEEIGWVEEGAEVGGEVVVGVAAANHE